MTTLNIQCLFHWKDDVFNLGNAVVFQNLSVGHWDVYTGHSSGRCIQVVKSGTCNKWDGKNVRSDSKILLLPFKAVYRTYSQHLIPLTMYGRCLTFKPFASPTVASTGNSQITYPPWPWRKSQLLLQTVAIRPPPSPDGWSSSHSPQWSQHPEVWWCAGLWPTVGKVVFSFILLISYF